MTPEVTVLVSKLHALRDKWIARAKEYEADKDDPKFFGAAFEAYANAADLRRLIKETEET